LCPECDAPMGTVTPPPLPTCQTHRQYLERENSRVERVLMDESDMERDRR
jgi:hypothetical protein